MHDFRRFLRQFRTDFLEILRRPFFIKIIKGLSHLGDHRQRSHNARENIKIVENAGDWWTLMIQNDCLAFISALVVLE